MDLENGVLAALFVWNREEPIQHIRLSTTLKANKRSSSHHQVVFVVRSASDIY
jgi:hypothetical protein